jgi:transcriptional regulator GlxA family with amidase domain
MSAPHRVLFLAYPGFQLLDLAGPLQMFMTTDAMLGGGAYAVRVAAREAGTFPTSAGLAVVADLALRDVDDAVLAATDTLISVGGGGRPLEAALEEGAIARVLTRAQGRVPRIASVCTGAFFLASAGLLDGKRATTHWESVERLRAFRPGVDVDPDAIFVRDGDVWTSAGVTAGMDLALAMIEADRGRAAALATARRMVVFRIRPGGQAQFSADLAAQATEDRRLARLAEAVRVAPHEDWRLERLTAVAGMSTRTLSRACRDELGASPAAFVERVRLDAARRALVETDRPIERVARDCGFASLRRMDRAFARVLGVSPRAFRRRFSNVHDTNVHDQREAAE